MDSIINFVNSINGETKDDNEIANEEIVDDVTETNNSDSPLSEKEVITQNLENKSPSIEKKDLSITLEFGDIIEIIAPSNNDINEMTALITYIDNEKIKLVDVATYVQYKLNITEDGQLSDESITQINLLSRSEEKGYARQNGLLPKTWVDIHFGGDIPVIITGEITNLEEDMIEITTFPELRTIYMNFGYKGLPENIPIENIIIRSKPASVKVGSITMLKGDVNPDEEQTEEGDISTIEFTETGESIISVPENVKPEEDVRSKLHELYIESNSIVFGEKLGEVSQMIEIPEGNQRYGIDVQINDMMDELLSTVPNSQRTKSVLDNIHILIDRYRVLRSLYSKFDKNDNVYDAKTVGAHHKPLIEHLEKMDKNLKWLVPVVSNRKKLYNLPIMMESNDSIIENVGISLRKIEGLQNEYYKENSKGQSVNYKPLYNSVDSLLTPYEPPVNKDSYLYNTQVLANFDSVIDNLEDFYSTVYTSAGLSKRQFIIQRYNLGLTYLDQTIMKSGKSVYIRKNISGNDNMTVNSLLMLPEPVIRFSSIDLPGTSILQKSTLHQNYFMLFRLLKKNLDILPHVINDLSKEMDYEKMEDDTKTAFFSGIHQFILDKEVYVDNDEKFNKFLEVIIPKTRFLIRLIRKHLKDKLSFVNVVQQLEPFMVYPSDITYKQYLEIRYTIKERIQELKVEIENKSARFSKIRNAKYEIQQKPNPILRLLSEKKDFTEAFFQSYHFLLKDKLDTKMSSNEVLLRMLDGDACNLYTNTITSILISLMTPTQLIDILNDTSIDNISDLEKIKPTDCSRRYLAKKYTSVKGLQEDNDEDEIYFDKDYDDSPYHIIAKYKKNQEQMSPELFLEFMEKTLIEKHDCPRGIANDLAKTLISGKKTVEDGNYAMLEITPKLPDNADPTLLSRVEQESIDTESDIRKKVQYFRRLKNNWVKDNEISEDAFIDTNTLFCNLTANCYKNTKNDICENTGDSYDRMKQIAKKNLINEFDKRYSINVDELEKELEKNIIYHLKMLKKSYLLSEIQLYKPSRLAFELGNFANINDVMVSPNMKLRDLILGQDDFVKKQYDICRFVDKYCREPMVTELEEDPNWFYCKDTNMKLFPFSIYELARTFISGGDYLRKQDEVCHNVGVLSDDGDSIVDKYSGFVIRKLDFATEEGYNESGFRVTTYEVMEKDLGTTIMEMVQQEKQKDRVFENESSEVIYNVTATICRNIDVPVESIEDYVMVKSRELFDKAIYTEASYKKKSDLNLKNKGKPLQAYLSYRNETRLFIIACNILIAIQTAIPSFKTKKTFPGCIRSFSGYPLDGGVEDMTGIKYIACVLEKTESSIAPWDAISKYKSDTISKRMKDLMDNFVLKNNDVNELYVKKREYILTYPDLVSPQEHNISKWKQFLPPVVEYTIVKELRNVSSDFKKHLDELIRKGSSDQNNSINVLKSKLIQYGYGIIETINNIVKQKETILKNGNRIPFLENACCNEISNSTNPITYFNEEDNNILLYIQTVKSISEVLKNTRILSSAPFLYHPEFTGVRYSNINSNNLNDPEIIYSAFIHYCNFDRNMPIPEKFKVLCNEKPAMYNSALSLPEKIELLKSNAVRYNVDNLHQLINLVNQGNIIGVEEAKIFTKVDALNDILEHLDSSNSTVIEAPLRNLIKKVINSYDPKKMLNEKSNEINDIQNYLINTNRELYRQIIDFFGRYGNLSETKYQNLHKFLSNIEKWNLDTGMKESHDSGMYSVTQFINNSIQAISKTYPSILLNDQGFYKRVPKHWGISEKHGADVSTFIDKYYSDIEKFKGDAVILRLLQEVGIRLVDLNTFVQNIPINTEITKTVGEATYSFYSLFDKTTIYLLFSYCFYSTIYEYIVCSNDIDLLRADVQESKKNRRDIIANNADESNLLFSQDINDVDVVIDTENEINEVNIVTGNTEELKMRVAALLLSFLNVEEGNKDAIDMSYADIMKKVKRSKDEEKSGIIKYLGDMTIEERRIEQSFKNYKLGRWNVGEQKGLYEYDKDTYDRERDELLKRLYDEDETADVFGETNDVEVGDLDAAEINGDEDDYNRGTIDIRDLGENFLDGEYYEEDRDTDFLDD